MDVANPFGVPSTNGHKENLILYSFASHVSVFIMNNTALRNKALLWKKKIVAAVCIDVYEYIGEYLGLGET